TQSNPLDVLFTNPDGSPCQMPCLFGVRPGQMTVDDSLRVLQQHPLTHNMRKEILDNGIALQTDGFVLLVYSNNGTRINWLNLDRRLAYMDINGPLLNLFVYPTDKDTQYPSVGITHWLGFTSVEHYLRDINAR